MKQFRFYKLFSPFLNAFLHLGFFKKHMLNESEFIFGGGGVEWANSGKCVVDWAMWGRGINPHDKKSADFRSLEVGISANVTISSG